LLVTASLAAPPRATTQPAAPRDTLARAVEALVAPATNAGQLSAALLIARGDRAIYERGFGFANWELRVPVTASTRFNIGSITKAMTQMVVEQLVHEGRLDLRAPVAQYLPGFPNGPKGGVPTVQHLLEHRAGVPWRVTNAIDETQHMHAADVVERVRAQGLLFEPGSDTLYSSAGYTCLARVMEVVEGKPFSEVLATRLFRPASMTAATGETGPELMPGRAMPYGLGARDGRPTTVSMPYKDLSFLTGAGDVYCTAADLLHFVRATHRGAFGDFAKSQLGPSGQTSWTGWYGRINGYEASVDYQPAGDLTIVFLNNLQSGATWQLRARFRTLLEGGTPTPILNPPRIAAAFEAPASIVGRYGTPDDFVDISAIDGRLYRDENEFYPMDDGWYYLPASSSRMCFRRLGSGAVDTLITRFGSGRLTARPRMDRN
jgi:CubicO group peptidase (beta-lactamase class C family)